MRAQVPYLARLARQTAGRATLRPPRQLFVSDIYTPVPSQGRGDSPQRHGVYAAAPSFPHALPLSDAGEELRSPRGIIPPRRIDTGGERASGDPDASADSAEPAPSAGVPAPQVMPAARTESAPPAITASVTPVDAGLVAQPTGPLTSGSSRPAGDVARAQPPESWTSPLWGTPVDLPRTIKLPPVTGETDVRVAASRSGAAVPPSGTAPVGTSGPAPVGMADSPQGQQTGDTGISVAPPSGPGPVGMAGSPQGPSGGPAGILVPLGSSDAADPDHSERPAAVRDLLPPHPSAPRSMAVLDLDPGGSDHKPRVSGRPRVSIGTIEVTVVPPAPAALPAPAIRPPAQVVPGWSRPPSLLAASAGADRLRDGLRRWYGTAQG